MIRREVSCFKLVNGLHGAEIQKNDQGGKYNSAIQAALCQGHKGVIDVLQAQGDAMEGFNSTTGIIL